MTGLRGLTIAATIARSLALFAILLQFTLPFGVAVAASLTPQVEALQVFDCLGGDPSEPSTASHHCALPGGCCIAPALAGLAVDRKDAVTSVSQVDWAEGTLSLRHDFIRHVPWPRGPPAPLL